MTQEQLQQIVALGKRATKRPWQWATSNSHRRLSNEQQDGKVAFGTEQNDGVDDIVISQHDMDYSEAAANSADILAQQLLDIGKLPDDATMKDVRKILGGRDGQGR